MPRDESSDRSRQFTVCLCANLEPLQLAVNTGEKAKVTASNIYILVTFDKLLQSKPVWDRRWAFRCEDLP